jgi:hypothetical protein
MFSAWGRRRALILESPVGETHGERAPFVASGVI